MSASRLSALVLTLLIGVLATGQSALLEPGLPAVAEKARGAAPPSPARTPPAPASKPALTAKCFKGTGYALLVGCTKYDNLDDKYQLEGPANDVLLLRGLLLKHGFLKENVVILSEAEGKKRRPIKAHIKAEFERLARVAKEGDLVFIELGGHGSRQPTTRPPERAKPDGLDETFLPADVGGKWDDSAQTVPNAITDTEISAWLQAIRKNKATVVFIADACHSSTLARDPEERDRRVEPEQLVPRAVLLKAEKKAAEHAGKTRGAPPSKLPFTIPAEAPDLAALYAAQTTEPTVERRLPIGSRDARPHGLFTYTLVKVVTEARSPLTYRQLIERIQAQYTAQNRSFPTPAVEGKDRDSEFLASPDLKDRRPRPIPTFLLEPDGPGWKIDGGSIHGLSVGSILAVYPPAGSEKVDKPLGHVRVTRLEVLHSLVEAVAHAGMPPPEKLSKGGQCKPVFIDYGDQKMRVAYVPGMPTPLPKEKAQRVEQVLESLGKATGALIEVVKEPRVADWLVVGQAGKVSLTEAAAWRRANVANPPRLLGSAPVDEKLSDWLKETLSQIARAHNLLGLTGDAAHRNLFGRTGPEVVFELLRIPEGRRGGKPQVVSPDKGRIDFKDGDIIGVRITNRGREAVDVTVLFIDSDLGITSLFPKPGTVANNRLLPPGESEEERRRSTITLGPLRVNGKTVGFENLVLITVAAKGGGPARDFSCLEQPSIAKARAIDAKSALDSPLGKLFQRALYGKGKQRGLSDDTRIDYSLAVRSWYTSPREPAKPR